MQTLLNTIADLMQEKNLPGLMIGGHAVTALGYPRATFDLDLLIPRHAAQAWRVALTGLRYSLFAESDNFHQYEAPADFPLPPIDLMLVDEDVFTTLEISKTATKPIAVPSVEAMIALKLHAAKQSTRTEREKDWSDIIALFKAHQLRLEEVTIHAMVLRHGGADAINRIQASLAGGN
ncbi:MAG: hypothetical protein WCI46_08340 [Verrucomicrobiota bacterium]